MNKNFNLSYGSYVKKHDTRLLIGCITFLTCGKSDTRHLIGLHRFANENLLRGFPVCKSQYVYNKMLYCRLKMAISSRVFTRIYNTKQMLLKGKLVNCHYPEKEGNIKYFSFFASSWIEMLNSVRAEVAEKLTNINPSSF